MRSAVLVAGLTILLSAHVAFAQTLAGAIDMHAHGDPDGLPRKVDVIAVAKARTRAATG